MIKIDEAALAQVMAEARYGDQAMASDTDILEARVLIAALYRLGLIRDMSGAMGVARDGVTAIPIEDATQAAI